MNVLPARAQRWAFLVKPSRALWGPQMRWGFTQAAGVSGGVLGFEDHSEPPRTLRDQVTQL